MKKIFLLTAVSLAFALSGCKNENATFELPTPVGSPNTVFFEPTLLDDTNPESIVTTLSKDKLSVDLTLNIAKASEEFTPKVVLGDKQVNALNKYATFKGVPSYTILPKDLYTITASTVAVGENKATIKVDILDFSKITFGTFYIPVVVNVGGKDLVHFVTISKEGDYVPLSDDNPKPLAPGTSRTEPMKMVAFVETNDWDPRNMAQFLLKDSRQPVFDMIVFFAPNMNYDGIKKKRYIYFNDKLQPIVNNPDIYIKPITDRGIKVIFEILPNHQGVGYKNFQSYEEALEFAREAKMWTDKLGIDGWDIDEEYADYGKRPDLPRKSTESFLWYMRAMKEVMPDKLLTLYEVGIYGALNGSSKDSFGKYVNDYIDYAFADYGDGAYGSMVSASKDKYFGYSVEANRNGLSSVERNATRTLNSGYTGLMFFNITGDKIKSGEAERELSKATQLFYGQDCEFTGKYYNGPKDN